MANTLRTKKTLTVTDTAGNTLDSAVVEVLRSGCTISTATSAITSGGGTGTIKVMHPGQIKLASPKDILNVVLAANLAAGTIDTTVALTVDTVPTFNQSTLIWEIDVTNNGSANYTPAQDDRLVLTTGVVGHRVDFSFEGDLSAVPGTAVAISPTNGMVQIWVHNTKSVDFVTTSGADVRLIADENVGQSNYIDPRDFGLPIEATTIDAAPAIQAALWYASLTTTTGGIVELPAGNFKLLTALQMPLNVSLRGQGKGVTILTAAVSAATAFAEPASQSGKTEHAVYKDFTIECDTTLVSTPVWDATDFVHCTWQDMEFDNKGETVTLLLIAAAGKSGGKWNRIFNTQFNDALDGEVATGIDFGAAANENVVFACRFNGMKTAVRAIGAGCNQDKVAYCSIENWSQLTTTGNGAVVFGGTGHHISIGNRFEQTGGNGDAHQIVDGIVNNRCIFDSNFYSGTMDNQIHVFASNPEDIDYWRVADGGKFRVDELAMTDLTGAKWTSPMAMGNNKLVMGDDVDSGSLTDNQFLQLMHAASNAFDYSSDPGSILMAKSPTNAGQVAWGKYAGTGAAAWAPLLSLMAGYESIVAANIVTTTVQSTIIELTGTTDVHHVKLVGSPREESVAGRLLVLWWSNAAPGNVNHQTSAVVDGNFYNMDLANWSPAQYGWSAFIGEFDSGNSVYRWRQFMRG